MNHKVFLILALAALASFALSSCSKEDPITPEYQALLDQGGQYVAQAPTDWVVKDEIDIFPKSMLVVIDQSGLPTPIAKGDMISAWVDGVCRAVSTPLFGDDDYTRFQFKISLPTNLITKGDNYVEIRYYSASHQLIFTSNPVLFIEDTQLGTYRAGYNPKWKK